MDTIELGKLPNGSLFTYEGCLALKSEYRTEAGAVEAFIVGSGEMFWGGVSTAKEQVKLMVTPVFQYTPQDVLEFISLIRNSFIGSETVYTEGSCYQLYLILQNRFPDAVAYYNSHHVITRIGDKYYDITGEVQVENHLEMSVHYVHTKVKECKFSITPHRK